MSDLRGKVTYASYDPLSLFFGPPRPLRDSPAIPRNLQVVTGSGRYVWADCPYGWTWAETVWCLPVSALDGPLWEAGGMRTGDAL